MITTKDRQPLPAGRADPRSATPAALPVVAAFVIFIAIVLPLLIGW